MIKTREQIFDEFGEKFVEPSTEYGHAILETATGDDIEAIRNFAISLPLEILTELEKELTALIVEDTYTLYGQPLKMGFEEKVCFNYAVGKALSLIRERIEALK